MDIAPETLLSVLPHLDAVGERAVAELARASSLRSYRTKAVLYRAGDVAAGLYLVLSGRVIVRRETASRSEMLHTERAGGVLGEIPVFGGGRFPATAVALEPTRCCHVPAAVVELAKTLTRREHEVMTAVVQGLMNKQIAFNLGISEITVKLHRGNVMRKMEARSVAELVRKAELLGL